MGHVSQRTQLAIRKLLITSAVAGGTLVVAVCGWAATTEFSGAVIASGSLVVESEVKKVQHQTGGIVSELRVKNGDRVEPGEILLKLDDTVLRANLAIVQKSLDDAFARRARLEAERDDSRQVNFPEDLLAREYDGAVAALITSERKLFRTRVAARSGQKSQLKERVGQTQEQIDGLSQQISAKAREAELIERELEGVQDLWRKKLVPIQRVTALERDGVRIAGEKGTLIANVAQSKGKVTETELQLIQIDQDLRAEVSKELTEVNAKIAELVERRATAEDQLKRVEVRSPQRGTVHQLVAHTVGGVVAQGEPIMLIVPSSDQLVVEAKIPPFSIDQLHEGQKAFLRFSAFNQRTTPELEGEVARISPDLTSEQKTGQSFYTLRIAIPQIQISRLKGAKLTPGMPVDAFITTEPRTVLTYFTKPLSDQVVRAFRER